MIENYKKLAHAVVRCAVFDYRNLIKQYLNGEYDYEFMKERIEYERSWFSTAWCATLLGDNIDGAQIPQVIETQELRKYLKKHYNL